MIIKKERDLGLDFMKCIATICVVLLHAGSLGRMFNVFHYMAGCAIPLFFMISGRLMISNYERHVSTQNTRNANLYILRRIGRIIFFVLIWVIPYTAMEYLTLGKITNPFITLGDSIVQKGAMSLFWYFWALMLLYLITPGICWVKNNSTLLYRGFLLFIICVCVIVSCVDLAGGGEIFEKRVPQTFRLYSHLMYYCIGDWIYGSKRIIVLKSKIEKNKYLCIGIMFL